MNCTVWRASNSLTPAAWVILSIGLVINGCATLGDVETANLQTQESVHSLKKEMKAADEELVREIRSLSQRVEALQNKDQEFNKQYEDIIRENASLQEKIAGVTGTIQAFLSAERRHYEEGLRMVDSAQKTVGKQAPELPGASPPTIPPPPESPPPKGEAPEPVVSQETGPASTVAVPTEIPSIKVLEVDIDPTVVERNSTMKVTVKYELKGNPESPALKYEEQIELLKGTLTIKNLKNSVERTSGTISFSQTIDVPPEAPPGLYTIQGSVSHGPARDSRIATFVVK